MSVRWDPKRYIRKFTKLDVAMIVLTTVVTSVTVWLYTISDRYEYLLGPNDVMMETDMMLDIYITLSEYLIAMTVGFIVRRFIIERT